jgi:hypothetical protein
VRRTCSYCGTTAEAPDDGVPAGWSFAVEGERVEYHCGPCVRENIRAIEGKLPQEWW